MKPHVGAIREKLQGLEPWSFGLQPRVLPLYYSFMIKERGLLRIELRVNASKASVFAITLQPQMCTVQESNLGSPVC